MGTTDPLRDVCELVAERAVAAPEAIAASDGARELTFRALTAQAAGLAAALREDGVGPEVRVAVLFDRSLDLLVSTLGVWKAGGAVGLVDPAWPEARRARMLDALAPRVVVTSRALGAASSSHAKVFLDDVGDLGTTPDGPRHLDQLAYVVSTSGTLGAPKLVGITHRALAHGIVTEIAGHRIVASDRGAWLAPPGSSLTGHEWRYIAAGASVHVGPDEVVASPRALQAWLLETRITKALVGMPVAEQLYRLPWPPETPLQLLLVGGDQVRTWAAADLPFEVAVEYGSAEADAVCSCLVPWRRRCTSRTATVADRAGRPPIGRAWPGVRLEVVDDDLQSLAPDALGELCVGGPHLARGYLDDPILTAERLVPAAEGSRVYRTGDLVRVRPDGLLEHHGRIDAQMKILGLRVDPAEVEAVLLEDPAVEAAVVATVTDPDGDQRLVAYLVAEGVSVQELRTHAEQVLPRHAVPSHFRFVASLPLNAAGKIDRGALPEPDWTVPRDRPPTPPEDDLERELVEIWQRALGVSDVGAEDDLFSLGGDSFSAAAVTEAIETRCGVQLRLRDVLQRRTPAGIAALVRDRAAAAP